MTTHRIFEAENEMPSFGFLNVKKKVGFQYICGLWSHLLSRTKKGRENRELTNARVISFDCCKREPLFPWHVGSYATSHSFWDQNFLSTFLQSSI
jgi:hypothetical protein